MAGPGDEGKTREVNQPVSTSADDQSTRALSDVGIVGELRAQFSGGETKTLPLYAMPDSITVGRGTACDWQLDDDSLSRRHAQFKWSGTSGALTVEDLGSANGTRVAGRPARNAIQVRAGEQVQLGTVMVTLELRQANAQAAAQPKPAGPDEQSTRLVSSPAADFSRGVEPTASTPSPLPPAPTVIRPQPAPGAANARAQVFRPERDAARPDEPTRSWDPRAVLVRAPEKALDASELIENIKAQWRSNRRMFVLAGASAWIALLLIVWSFFEPKPPEDDPFAATSLPQVKAPKPTVTQLPTQPTPTPAAQPANAPPTQTPAEAAAEDAATLERAISAYDQGRLPDALIEFRALAQRNDASAQFMVTLIEARIAQGGTP
jgi:predicted component of type VI protein secretion system